ncbi:MAG: alkaline phosphatase family protein [Candidatus Eisenbacteria bacterium]
MRRTVIVFLIDAFGWDLQETRPFLAEHVHRRPLKTILGFSSAAIPTLLTGKHPDEHGRWFLYRRSRSDSPFGFAGLLAPFARGPLAAFVRAAYEKCFDHFTNITGYYHLYRVPLGLLPRFDLPEKRPVYLPGGVDGAPTLFDRIEEAGIPSRVWFWRTREEDNFGEILAAVREGEETFLFFYASELDALMHARGTDAPETRGLMDSYEARIRETLGEAEKRADEVELYVCSDHGMVDVKRIIDLMGDIRSLPFREGKDYLPFYDSTFARFWFFSGAAEKAIRDRLENAAGGRLLGDDELHRLRVLFPDREYGEAVFVTGAGTVIAPSFMGDRAPAAMHGYHPDDPGSDGLVISNRPLPERDLSIRDMAALLEGAARRAAEDEGHGERP